MPKKKHFSTSVENLRFIEKVMHLTLDYEMHDEILWNRVRKNGALRFVAAVMCNDAFYWGTADAEDVSEETLPLLEQAYADCEAVEGDEVVPGKHVSNQYFGGLLYCARQREMRPQGALYQHLPPEIHHLFDACGPEREIDIFNPENQEGEYLYTKEEQEE